MREFGEKIHRQCQMISCKILFLWSMILLLTSHSRTSLHTHPVTDPSACPPNYPFGHLAVLSAGWHHLHAVDDVCLYLMWFCSWRADLSGTSRLRAACWPISSLSLAFSTTQTATSPTRPNISAPSSSSRNEWSITYKYRQTYTHRVGQTPVGLQLVPA